MVSNHRFSGSRNLFLVLDIMYDEQKTLIGTLWVSAIMPKLLKLSKTVNMPSREVKVVSKHMFSRSRNLSLTLDFMCEEEKTLIGALWVSAIMSKLLKVPKTVNMPSREVKMVSNHRFPGSRNHFLASDIMCDEEKTLIGA